MPAWEASGPPGASHGNISTLQGVSGNPLPSPTRDREKGLKVIETERGLEVPGYAWPILRMDERRKMIGEPRKEFKNPTQAPLDSLEEI